MDKLRLVIYGIGAVGGGWLLLRKKCPPLCGILLLVGSLLALGLELPGLFGEERVPLQTLYREKGAGQEALWRLVAEEGDGAGEALMPEELSKEGTSYADDDTAAGAGAGQKKKRQVTLHLAPQRYSSEELRKLCAALKEELEQGLLKQNESAEYVTGDLWFPERVEGYPFMIQWTTDRPELLTSEGRLGKQIPKEGVLVEIHARILEQEASFEAVHSFFVKLFPSQGEEAFWERLEQSLQEKEEETRDGAYYQLPERFEGRRLRFYQQEKGQSSRIFFCFLIGAGAAFWGQKKEVQKQKKERQKEMEREYPAMVSRITMLIGAGMSISGAFGRIAGEYGKRKPQKCQPLYEELLVACREMQSGISELTAYQNLGKRCALPCMVRFTALLIQYTRSGTAGLRRALWEETEQALKERKESAVKRGEEAGTKLLLPMVGMLVLVMVLIMIPAFTAFGL